MRQAHTLLRLAKAVRDPAVSAELLSKAADLEERAKGVIDVQPLVTPAIQDQEK